MAAGPLRERVRFERRASGSGDGYGNVSTAWSELDVVSAEVRPMRGSEQVLATKLEGREPVEIRVRFSSTLANLTTDDRAVNVRTGATFNVRSVENRDQRKKYLTVIAEAGVAT